MKAISLFSGAGIGELFLEKELGIKTLAANEIDSKRAALYSYFYPDVKMHVGNIQDVDVKNKLFAENEVDLILATPPCQGVSSLGKNKTLESFNFDKRNFLIYDVFQFIDRFEPKAVVIENTERFALMLFPHKKSFERLEDILIDKYGKNYNVVASTLNCQDFGIPQSRPRSIFILYKHELDYCFPQKEKKITLEESIGHLPSLNPGEHSNLKWHYAKPHKPEIVECLRHTPPGRSALSNKTYFPKNNEGKKISGFHNTYKRMKWSEPCHARTTYMGSPSSHNNIHPGRPLKNKTYSDPRVLTLLETFIVSTIPESITFPEWASDNLIRTVIGEGVPPLFLKKILSGLNK